MLMPTQVQGIDTRDDAEAHQSLYFDTPDTLAPFITRLPMAKIERRLWPFPHPT
jgi:hypothetical protein